MKEYNVFGINVTDYEGNNPPLLFIHSFPLTSKMWNKQIDYFKNEFRVLTYDLRGLGKSDNGDYIFSMEKFANDLFHIINKLKIDKINVCGLSTGGYIILRAVLKNPERFNSIILVNTKANKDTDKILLKRSNNVIKIKSGGRKAYLDNLIPKLFYSASEKIQTEIENIINENSDDGICAGLMALSTRVDTIKQLNILNLPVLLINSEFDEIYSGENRNKLFDALSSNKSNKNIVCKFNIENTGHLCNMENPEYFNKIVKWFLKSIENQN